jgi:hypothetical protein
MIFVRAPIPRIESDHPFYDLQCCLVVAFDAGDVRKQQQSFDIIRLSL